MKQRLYAWVVTFMMITGLVTMTGMAAEVSFTDTSGHWAEEAIASVVEKGLFKGTSETTFSPDLSMDRGMFVTVLGRFVENTGIEIKGDSTFEDVSQTAYYAPYVAWAADQGIVKGTSETTFSPTQPVTREQMCALFIRLLDYAKYTVPSPEGVVDFTDQTEISDYAQSNVMSATALGLIKGIQEADGMAFHPQESATRAQVAMVFLRLDGLEGIYDVFKPEDPASAPDPVTPSPSGPGTVTPVNPPSDVTEEEKAREAEVAEYMTTMLANYKKLGEVKIADREVQDCMKTIMDSLENALNKRTTGTFISKEYVEEHYAPQIAEAKTQYRQMSENQKTQMQNIVLQLEKLSHLRTVLNYFGFNGVL